MNHLLILCMLAGTASAESHMMVTWGRPSEPPPQRATIRLHGSDDAATLDDVSLSAATLSSPVRVELSFRLSTEHRDARQVRLPFDVSADTVITGMSYSVGGEPSIAATMHDADAAQSQYNEIVERARDPALLRLVSRGERVDRHELAVYPISRGMPARVTIQIMLPAATELAFDPGPRRIPRVDVRLDGKQTRWTNVKDPTVLALPPRRDEDATVSVKGLHVDESTSLFADDEPDREQPVPIARREKRTPTVSFSDRRFDLRRMVRAHAKQLGHCYAYAVLKNPQRSPEVHLDVDVAADGRLTRVDVLADADEELAACIATEVETWKLRAVDQARSVSQDLDLLHLD